MSQEAKTALPAWTHFAAGGSGALVGCLATSPLEVVKTRLQAYRNKTTLLKAQDTSMIGTRTFYSLRTIYQEGGIRGLYRGLGPSLTSVVPARAIHFSSYAWLKRNLIEFNNGIESTFVHISSAIGAGFIVYTTTNPLWVIKTRMQLQSSSFTEFKPYTNSFNCFLRMYKEEGPRAFTKGLSASYIGISESTLQFALYEQLKHSLLLYTDDTLYPIHYLLASSMSKGIASMLTYPHEVVRTRLREQRGHHYRGFWDCVMKVYRREGTRGLYGGMGAHLLRVIPNAAVMFATYEAVLKFCL